MSLHLSAHQMHLLATSPSAQLSRGSTASIARGLTRLQQPLKLCPPSRLRSRQSLIARTDDNVTVESSSGSVAPVNDDTFEELVLKSPVPVVVDFWAPWCGPCRMIAPLIDQLAEEYGDKLRCVKLNTDESSGTANKYGIRSIPTVILFKGGEKVDTVIGAVPKDTLQRSVNRFLD